MDIIVTYAIAPTLAAKQATSIIPIVFATAGDPVGTGLVASLPRAGRSSERMKQFKMFEYDHVSPDAEDSIYWVYPKDSRGITLGTLKFFRDGRAEYTEKLFNDDGKVSKLIQAHCHLAR